MNREKAIMLVKELLLTRPQLKGFLKTREEAVYWIINQIYLCNFEIVETNPNPESILSEAKARSALG